MKDAEQIVKADLLEISGLAVLEQQAHQAVGHRVGGLGVGDLPIVATEIDRRGVPGHAADQHREALGHMVQAGPGHGRSGQQIGQRVFQEHA